MTMNSWEVKTNDLLRRERLDVETPQEIFNSQAYAERVGYINPITGEMEEGFDNIGATSLNTMLDTSKNAMINTSVDRNRARQDAFIKKGNPKLKNQLYDFMKKRDENRNRIKNQFGEFVANVDEGEDTVRSVLASRARDKTDIVDDNTDLTWDPLTVEYSFGDEPPPQPAMQQEVRRVDDETDDEEYETKRRPPSSDFILKTNTSSGPRQPPDGGDGAAILSSADVNGAGQLGLRIKADMSSILNILYELGYDENQISGFLLNESVDFDEFAGR